MALEAASGALLQGDTLSIVSPWMRKGPTWPFSHPYVSIVQSGFLRSGNFKEYLKGITALPDFVLNLWLQSDFPRISSGKKCKSLLDKD